MAAKDTLLSDFLSAIKVWRVWLYLGLQDVKVRFRGSLIGPMWLLINLGMFVIGAGVVYGSLFQQDMADFLPFLTAGFVIWGFIVSTCTDSGSAFINAEGYIKQFSYPKQIYLLRNLVSFTVIFFLGLIPVAGVLIFYGRFEWTGLLCAIPGILLLLMCGFSHITIFAYLSCRFRDIPHGMTGIFQVMFFVTPIIFPVKLLRDRGLDFIYQFNPLYYLIEMVRFPLISGDFAPDECYIFGGLYFLVMLCLGYIAAKKLDHKVVFLI
jgi:lipopolysaccharide transport system permease protein